MWEKESTERTTKLDGGKKKKEEGEEEDEMSQGRSLIGISLD